MDALGERMSRPTLHITCSRNAFGRAEVARHCILVEFH